MSRLGHSYGQAIDFNASSAVAVLLVIAEAKHLKCATLSEVAAIIISKKKKPSETFSLSCALHDSIKPTPADTRNTSLARGQLD